MKMKKAQSTGRTDSLSRYEEKRDFSLTAEPAPKDEARTPTPLRAHFVVQRHDARRLHYDVRFEIGGALASWAVPKGPSYDPNVRRLAVETEDHPMAYAGFEGKIPEGEYGGGDVIVWDRGTYETVPPGRADEMREEGHLHVRLFGEKLEGEWHLIRTEGREGAPKKGEKSQWLFFKAKDKLADEKRDIVTERPESVLSIPATGARALLEKFGETMRATNPAEGAKLPRGDEFWFEIKYDGYRLIAAKSGDEVRLCSRNGKDWTDRFPIIAEAIAKLPAREVALDGEACAVDEQGNPSFQRLQHWIGGERKNVELVYVAFDLLFVDGEDVRGEPIENRRERLRALLEDATSPLSISTETDGDPKTLLEACRARGLEGLVAKRKGSRYVAGPSALWLKLKCDRRADFAVVGYLPLRGTSNTVGALLLGAMRDGKMLYAGRCGTGFSDMQRRTLAKLLDAERIDAPPAEEVESPLKSPHWSKAKLCVEVAYTEITDDHRLRHPKLVAVREDKSWNECVWPDDPRRPRTIGDDEDEPPQPAPIRSWPKPTLANREKVLFPRDGITKRELWEFAEAIAPTMLPHLVGRPLNMQRWPNGIDGEAWYQHRPGEGKIPEFVRLIDTGEAKPHVAADNVETLQWLANLAAITLHQWASRAPEIERPEYAVIDLDPGDGTWADLVRVAEAVRTLLEAIEAESVVKTSGKRGVHVFVPLMKTPHGPTHDEATRFAFEIATAVAKVLPEICTVERVKAKRGGRLYVDAFQNGLGRTVVCPYTIRAIDGAPVSAPIEWGELTNDLDAKTLNVRTMMDRLGKKGDLFAPILKAKGIDVGRVIAR